MKTVDKLNISDLVGKIKQDLVAGERARKERNEPPMFALHEMELDIKFIVTKSEKAGAEFNVVVATGGGGVTYGAETVQSIRLRFKTVSAGLYGPWDIGTTGEGASGLLADEEETSRPPKKKKTNKKPETFLSRILKRFKRNK
ncbi:hypothetical protein MYX78_11555 [Acidobacteria bacterium AH-259-G07]|nr:hypothetical protein [Acidobacteria bacterium AH-259-G07]